MCVHVVEGYNSLALLPRRTIYKEEPEEPPGGMGTCSVGGAIGCMCTTRMVCNTSCTLEGVAIICANCSAGGMAIQSRASFKRMS